MTKLIKIPEAAERLSIGRSTAYRSFPQWGIPIYELPNGRKRVDEADIERFLTECRRERGTPEPMPRPTLRRGARRGTFSRALEAVKEGAAP